MVATIKWYTSTTMKHTHRITFAEILEITRRFCFARLAEQAQMANVLAGQPGLAIPRSTLEAIRRRIETRAKTLCPDRPLISHTPELDDDRLAEVLCGSNVEFVFAALNT
ncbi:MAG TPA: hypothetical protein VHD56_02520 [Tepidisphaeraceae bacterium]|nr:hypothetical protein [Tepidisphaeraceae bacterium]